MSKELEALKGIKQAIAKHLHKQTGVSVEKHFEYLQNDTEISIIEQAITPPTADEVCKALSEYFGEEVIFLVNDKEFVIKCNIGYKYIVETDDVLYYIKVGLPLYLITLIGRFYEGVTG